jgi:hypothetical protein
MLHAMPRCCAEIALANGQDAGACGLEVVATLAVVDNQKYMLRVT